MRGHLICVSHQNSLNHCDSYLTLIQERLIGNRMEDMHLLSCFLWCEWHHQGLGDLPLCVRLCVSGYQEVCLRKVTGSDRLWACATYQSDTHAFFLACYPPCTHKGMNTHSAELYVTLLCWVHLQPALFSNSYDRSLITFTPSLHTSHHHRTPLYYFCLSISLSLSLPSSHAFI